MGQGMLNPMIVELGFSDTEFVAINKGVGFVALIIGSACGAPFIAWLGMGRGRLVWGRLIVFSNLRLAVMEAVAPSPRLLGVAGGRGHLPRGMGSPGFYARDEVTVGK